MSSTWQLVEQIRMEYFQDSIVGEASDQQRTRMFLRDLRTLSKRLRDHFEVLEQGDSLEEAVYEAPHLATVAATLESLRHELWNYIRRFSVRVKTSGISQALTEEVKAEFDEFLELLYDYEQTVDQILRIDELTS
ncbi:MAG: hypothetical protein K8T91_20515 [Planctomycetes bacterium]|nr:hypothetical protein [Planctomycetota bacterium]